MTSLRRFFRSTRAAARAVSAAQQLSRRSLGRRLTLAEVLEFVRELDTPAELLLRVGDRTFAINLYALEKH